MSKKTLKGDKKKIQQLTKSDIAFWKMRYEEVSNEYSKTEKQIAVIEKLLPEKKEPVYYSILGNNYNDTSLEGRVLNLIVRASVAEKTNEELRKETHRLWEFIRSLTNTNNPSDDIPSDRGEPRLH